MGDIYGIKYNNKIVYVGQTIRTYQKRWSQYKQNSKDLSLNYALYNAMRKYGVENFSVFLIEQCDNSSLNEKEQYWIKYYHTNIKEQGYNLTDGGDNNSQRQKKIIHQYTLEGEHIQSYLSIADAQQAMKSTGASISKAANGRLNQAYGYRWSFIKVDKLPNNYKSNAKLIKQYDLNDNFIQNFESVRKAAIAMGNVNRATNISSAALGKRPTAYGYKWSY